MNVQTMLRNLEKKLAINTAFARCRYTTVDGKTVKCKGLSVIEPFLDGKIKELTIDDEETARILGALDHKDTVKITLVKPGEI